MSAKSEAKTNGRRLMEMKTLCMVFFGRARVPPDNDYQNHIEEIVETL